MQQLKPIPQYEGLYSLTPDGLVWSHPKAQAKDGKWKKPQKPKGEHNPRVVLSKDSKATAFSIDKLIQLTYGDTPCATQV